MGFFKKRSADTAAVGALREEISDLAARLDRADAENQQLRSTIEALQGGFAHEKSLQDNLATTVNTLAERLDTPLSPPPADTPPADQGAAIDQIKQTLTALAERIEGVDTRVTSVSTELANQLTELSTEIDRGEDGQHGASDEVIVVIRDAQEKLAREQARYQIQFRQDLAELADNLKRGRA